MNNKVLFVSPRRILRVSYVSLDRVVIHPAINLRSQEKAIQLLIAD
jgi:hypothetical protein